MLHVVTQGAPQSNKVTNARPEELRHRPRLLTPLQHIYGGGADNGGRPEDENLGDRAPDAIEMKHDDHGEQVVHVRLR